MQPTENSGIMPTIHIIAKGVCINGGKLPGSLLWLKFLFQVVCGEWELQEKLPDTFEHVLTQLTKSWYL